MHLFGKKKQLGGFFAVGLGIELRLWSQFQINLTGEFSSSSAGPLVVCRLISLVLLVV